MLIWWFDIEPAFPFSYPHCRISSQLWDFAGGLDGKESARNVRDLGSIPGLGRSSEEGNGSPLYSSILAWRMPWTEEPGGLESSGSQTDTTERLNIFTSLMSVIIVRDS